MWERPEGERVRKLTLLNCVWTMENPSLLNEEASRKKYAESLLREESEFDLFHRRMRPIRDLFAEELNVDFDIRFCTVVQLFSLVKKTPEELSYLERYRI